MKRTTLGSAGQRSRPNEAEDTFRGLLRPSRFVVSVVPRDAMHSADYVVA